METLFLPVLSVGVLYKAGKHLGGGRGYQRRILRSSLVISVQGMEVGAVAGQRQYISLLGPRVHKNGRLEKHVTPIEAHSLGEILNRTENRTSSTCKSKALVYTCASLHFCYWLSIFLSLCNPVPHDGFFLHPNI